VNTASADAPIRVVVADRHPIVLSGIAHILQNEAGFELVALCADGHECIQAVRKWKPNVALIELASLGLSGLQVLAAIVAERLETRVVVLAATAEDKEIVTAAAAGAAGILLRDVQRADLVRCLRWVAAGQRWIPTEVLGTAAKQLGIIDGPSQPKPNVSLTQREFEILLLVAEGLSNKYIANRLNITEGTVKVHLHREPLHRSKPAQLFCHRRSRDRRLYGAQYRRQRRRQQYGPRGRQPRADHGRGALIAAVCEAAGALLAGGDVVNTISRDLLRPAADMRPQISFSS
jgi:two-component system, NarL family, nitrate/nitrite response regulator NarL